MLRLALLPALITSLVSAHVYLHETFTPASFAKWVPSEWKPASDIGTWDVSSGDWHGDAEAARGMRTTQDAKFYAISRKLDQPFSNKGKTLVVQFATKNEKKGSSFCAGGYIKLLPKGTDQSKFGGETPYQLMFGPDLCGYDVSRVHLIFSKNGENMLKKDDIKLEWNDKNEYTHLYTLVLRPDNTYQVLVDLKERASGSLGDGQWSLFPKKEIDDPSDKKPADWVDEAKVVDPDARKPDDWDEDAPASISDPNASKPEDWDDEEDGAWVAPMIDNPKYKGKWVAPMIDNPKYKGVWAPKKIPNLEYVGDSYVLPGEVDVVGFELWVVNSGSIFSNVVIADSFEEAEAIAKKTFEPFVEKEKEAKKAFDDMNKPKEEAAAEAAAGDDDDDDDHEEL